MADTLETLCWQGFNLAITATAHIDMLKMYRDEMVRPSLRSLDEKLAKLAKSNDPVDAFAHDDYASLHHSTVEGFLLTTQSAWERGLRGMMLQVAKQKNPKLDEPIKGARWHQQGACQSPGQRPSIQELFETLFEAPIDWFGCYDDLNVLQVMGNALRHGDGPSAVKLHTLCPKLWVHWMPPGTTIDLGHREFRVPDDAPRHPSFDHLILPVELLEQMIQAVLWFWEDIEFVRCSSFVNKHPSTVRMLDAMTAARPLRDQQRHWSRR